MAGLLVGFPLLDLLARVLPSDTSDALWRSRATALLGDGMLPILLGLFTAFSVALVSRHKRTLRMLSVVLGAAELGCVGSRVSWWSSYWDVGELLPREGAFVFGETSFVVTMKHVAALCMLGTLSVIAWEASPRAWRRRSRSPLVDVFAQAEPGPGATRADRISSPEPPREVPEVDPPAEARRGVASPAAQRGGAARMPGRDPETGEEIPAPPDDVLRSEVQALVDQGETLTSARRTVGRRYGISLTTVRNRTT